MAALSSKTERQGPPLLFQRTGRPDASMTLLTEVMEQPLDPSYAAAAAKRAEQIANGKPARVWHWNRSAPLVLILAIIIGASIAVGASNLYIPQSGARETRQLIVAQINDRTLAINQLSSFVTDISGELVGLQEAVLAAGDPELVSQLQIDESHNGRAAVSGPGMVVTLTDGGGGLTEMTGDHLVRDVDLQQVVSALWAAGAEAIAIGDQRLAMTTAIRNAGNAVLIDLVPVLGPTFQVTAIGNPALMGAAWNQSPVIEYLSMLGAEFGIASTSSTYSYLAVPNASPTALRYAQTLESIVDQTNN